MKKLTPGNIAVIIVGTFLMVTLTVVGINMSRIKTLQYDTAKADTFSAQALLIDTNNVRIQLWRHYYTSDSVSHVNKERRSFYYTTIKNLFLEAGFEEEKAKIYAEIPSIESNWLANAKSKAGAGGLWQFMPNTAAIYGVRQDQLNDPVITTEIAIAHIQDLDSLHHGDVAKVLFSYNGGIGTVNKYLTKNRTNNVWHIQFASREMFDYAPKVLGCYLAMNYDHK